MKPKFIMKKEDLNNINHLVLAKEILIKLKTMKINKSLPKDLRMIGIADNNLLGIFNLIQNDYGYECHRMYLDKDGELLVSDFGYQVTNIGEGTAPLDCEMDYIISSSQLNLI